MKRLCAVLATMTAVFAPWRDAAAAAEPRPNIILIVADDLGWGDIGPYGQKEIKTPHLDRMAAEGARFTNFYSGATVCAPSRSVLMTGLHTGHTRVRGNAGKRNPLAQALREEDVTLAEVLKRAGYATGMIGKWGLGDEGEAACGLPRRQGFDYFFGYLNQTLAHNYYPTFLWRNEEKIPLRNTESATRGVSDNKAQHAQDLLADEALAFIRRHREEPFFLYLPFTLPHANNEAGKRGMEIPDHGVYADRDWPEPQKGLAAMISRLDDDIGRVQRLLKELELDEKTLVLFTSDNGPHREGGNDPSFFQSSGPFRGIKRSHADGGIRVPFIARWPGRVPAGKEGGELFYFADILPTLAALANVAPPEGLDGINVLPAWLGETAPDLSGRLEERFLYWEFHEGGFKQAARRGNWKALREAPDAPLALYNLSEDVREERDRAAENPGLVAEFEAFLRDARTDSPDWPVKAAGKN